MQKLILRNIFNWLLCYRALVLLTVLTGGCTAMGPDRYVVSDNGVIYRVTSRGERIPHTGPNLPFYFLADGGLTWQESDDLIVVSPEKVLEARTAKAARPASRNPTGGWGRPAQDFQLALGFPKKRFRVGEALEGVLTIRNVGFREESIPIYSPNILTTFEITNTKGERVSPRPVVTPRTFQERIEATPQLITHYYIAAGTQRDFEITLDEQYDLPPGKYVVSCRWRPGRAILQPVISGQATIHVLAK